LAMGVHFGSLAAGALLLPLAGLLALTLTPTLTLTLTLTLSLTLTPTPTPTPTLTLALTLTLTLGAPAAALTLTLTLTDPNPNPDPRAAAAHLALRRLEAARDGAHVGPLPCRQRDSNAQLVHTGVGRLMCVTCAGRSLLRVRTP
jgi:hypothetical protein